MKLLIALALAAPMIALAAPTPSNYCVTKWWPRACAEVSDACITGQPLDQYTTLSDCLGDFVVKGSGATPTPTPDVYGAGYCVLNWYPRVCGDRAEGANCVTGSPTYDTEGECEGVDGVNEDGFCTTSWWPKSCAPVDEGNCIGNEYPPGGFADMSSCMGDGFQNDEVDGNLYCVTSWWPRYCDQVSEGDCVTGTAFYETEEGCTGRPNREGPGYCVSQWWPLECVEVGDGCIGWYPTDGYADMNECLGNPEKK